MKPKVVVTDWSFPNLEVESRILQDAGVDLVGDRKATSEELLGIVGNADAVITQFARLTPELIRAMRRTRGIVRYGVGVDNIDLDAAAGEGIPVCNVPDYCVDEVADHTLALILSALRQIPAHQKSVRSGEWMLAAPVERMFALRDLTVGVVGLGRIGRAVLARLKAFQCKLVAFDPAMDRDAIESVGAKAVSFDDLIREADIITLHCPLTPRTSRMISRDVLLRVKTGAMLLNVSRGGLVDSDALVEALESGRISFAALDVCQPEPPLGEHPFRRLENVILTPHIASVSPGAMRRLRESVARLALSAVRGELPENVVNGVRNPRTVEG